MQNKLYIKFENLDDLNTTLNTFYKTFQYLSEYYAYKNIEKLHEFLYSINVYFYTFFYLYKSMTDYEENDDFNIDDDQKDI